MRTPGNRKVHTGNAKDPRKMIARQLIPAAAIPAAIYAVASRFLPMLVALVMASSVPMLDMVLGLIRGRGPSLASRIGS